MARILMFSHVDINPEGKTFGPAIRILELAKALLKKGHIPTIVVNRPKQEQKIGKIKIIGYDISLLKDLKKKFDVVFVNIWFNDKDLLEKLKELPIVVDAYAPYLIEHIYYNYDLKKDDSFWRFTDDVLLSYLLPLQYGDYFVCASDRQRKYYLGILSALGRINPYNKTKNLVGIVPYGVLPGKPAGNKSILRKKIPKNKKIILWLSCFYPWIDPMQSAEIMHAISKKSEEYALAFVGAKSPFVHKSMYDENYEKVYNYAKEKGMLDKTVFFFDWLDHKDIGSIYNESTFFIVTYDSQSLETELSYRVRMTEALWGRLPVISNGGDVVSDIIREKNMGVVFEKDTAEETGQKILELKKSEISKMKDNIEKYLPSLRWDNLISPLDDFCKKPFRDNSKNSFMLDRLADDRRDLVIQLRKEIDEKEGHISNFQRALISKEVFQKELETSLNSIQKKLADAQNVERSLETSLNNMQKKLAGTQTVLDERDAEVNDLKNSLHFTQEKLADATNIIEEKNIQIGELRDVIEEKNIQIGELRDVIEDNKIQIEYLRNSIEEKSNSLILSNKEIARLKLILGRYRASVVYPFYKITSTIGETRVGKILQKLLK